MCESAYVRVCVCVEGGNSFFFIGGLLSSSVSERARHVCVQVSVGTGECDQTGEKWRGAVCAVAADASKLLFGVYCTGR